MLILERFRDQEIIIETPGGDIIRILVKAFRDDKASVELGIDAPRSYRILRGELTLHR